MVHLSSEPPYVEVEEEERNAQGRVIGTTYRMVQEEGPRRVATVTGSSDAQEFSAVKLAAGPTRAPASPSMMHLLHANCNWPFSFLMLRLHFH